MDRKGDFMRGGARPGAGRKPTPDKKIKVSFSLRPKIVDRLKMECNKNQSVEDALCKHLDIDLGE